MGVRKLRTVFMKYAIFLALGVFLVAFVNIALYLFGVEIGFIYPINRMSAEIENARGSLQSTDRITENEIPPPFVNMPFSQKTESILAVRSIRKNQLPFGKCAL